MIFTVRCRPPPFFFFFFFPSPRKRWPLRRENARAVPVLGKWHRRGEYQPAVGVLLLTQGVDGNEGAGP
jgi:hypothetical protein